MSEPRPTRQRRGIFARLGERTAQLSYIGLWVGLFVVAGFVSAGATWVPFFSRAETVIPTDPPLKSPPPPPSAGGLKMPARVVGTQIQPFVDGQYRPIFWAGVNLGSSLPGHDPGSVAATREDYDRWFAEMAELGVTVVRVYTILDPSFYTALREFNITNPNTPIYVLHGIWLADEERFYSVANAWDPRVVEAQRHEIRNAVMAVSGNGVIPERRGHAGGIYNADISPWLMGWSFGIEWDPQTVHRSDRANRRVKPYQGTYFRATPNATPMESWIASNMDYIAELQAARGWSVPMTFTNWDTTDPLRHPEEPSVAEDLVSIDANHIAATAKWPAGVFASYHAYPYYPDFLRWQPSYRSYTRPRDGAIDPYAGYINDLRRHHAGMPLMVTEFGQPTSLGCAHTAPLGRDQGCHSEQEAAANVVDMMRDLEDEGLAGGIVFVWLDEWFKFTWNTIDYELPGNRRSLWRNPLTNEERFGIIAAEPGVERRVTLDGRDREWTAAPRIGAGRNSVRDVAATSDAENVYLRLRVDPKLWMHKRIVIGLDARPGGNKGLPGTAGVDPDAEMAVVIEPGGKARIYHAGWIDPLALQFGGTNPSKAYIPTDLDTIAFESGFWQPLRQILSYPYVIPSTRTKVPVELRDASRLPWGPTDPADPAFDSRNLVMGEDGVLEIALPWGLMSFSDPSSHRLYVVRANPGAASTITTRTTDRLGISVAVDGEPLLTTTGFTWKGWDTVEWHERRKAGWPILREEYQSHLGPFARRSAG